MAISTLVLVVLLALVLMSQAPSVRGAPCAAGCAGLGTKGHAKFTFDAEYSKITATCNGHANQPCPLIAPKIFRCCDGQFDIRARYYSASYNDVDIYHNDTILVRQYLGTFRTDEPNWQTTIVSTPCFEPTPPTASPILYIPSYYSGAPGKYRMNTLEACYDVACTAPGSVCGDPKLVGGDGVVFYFHGRKDRDFCLVSDPELHVNAHFIGKRLPGRARDFTWVQALGFVFGGHSLTVAVKRVARWDSAVDHLEFVYDGEAMVVGPTSSWASPAGGAVALTRTGSPNVVDVEIKRKMGVSLTAVPIGEHESKVHGYGITGEDCMAHFNMQFRFYNLSTAVDGVLGRTYQPGFVNPAKRGVAMPVVGGADRFGSSSLLATDCAVSQYSATPSAPANGAAAVAAACGSSGLPHSVPGGITCRR